MCVPNAMQLSLNGDTFKSLKDDFDKVLARTIGNMEMKGANEATLTLKLSVLLEKLPDGFTESGDTKEITKPTFKHDISSVMQVKDKKSGALAGDFELVWDSEAKAYVMRHIGAEQTTIFDEEYENNVDGVAELPPAPEQEYIEAEYVDYTNESDDVSTTETGMEVYEWMKQFVGQKMNVFGVNGNYVLKSEKGKIVLTSASSPSNEFHCPEDVLIEHENHSIVCEEFVDEYVGITGIRMMCLDCEETIYSIKNPNVDTGYEAPTAEEMSDDYIEPEE